jgi:hypothetical protein
LTVAALTQSVLTGLQGILLASTDLCDALIGNMRLNSTLGFRSYGVDGGQPYWK